MLARPGLNVHQAELVIKTLKDCGPASMLLAAETLAALSEAQDWGTALNDSTAAALMYILKLRPDISQVTKYLHPYVLVLQKRSWIGIVLSGVLCFWECRIICGVLYPPYA